MKRSIRRLGAFQRYKGGVSCSTTSMSSIFTKFSPSSKVDLIVQKAIIDKQYDIMQLNVTLFKYTNEILGV